MAHPKTSRIVGVVISLAASATIVTLAVVLDARSTLGWLFVGVVAAVLLFGVIHTLLSHRDLRALERLRLRTDVIARWDVDEERWRRFIALDVHRGPGALVEHHRDPIAGPVEVIVADDAVSVGHFHLVLKQSVHATVDGPHWFEGPVPWLEYRFDADGLSFLRVPVGADAEPEARRRWSGSGG